MSRNDLAIEMLEMRATWRKKAKAKARRLKEAAEGAQEAEAGPCEGGGGSDSQ